MNAPVAQRGPRARGQPFTQDDDAEDDRCDHLRHVTARAHHHAVTILQTPGLAHQPERGQSHGRTEAEEHERKRHPVE